MQYLQDCLSSHDDLLLDASYAENSCRFSGGSITCPLMVLGKQHVLHIWHVWLTNLADFLDKPYPICAMLPSVVSLTGKKSACDEFPLVCKQLWWNWMYVTRPPTFLMHTAYVVILCVKPYFFSNTCSIRSSNGLKPPNVLFLKGTASTPDPRADGGKISTTIDFD